MSDTVAPEKKVAELAKDINIGMLTTVGAEGNFVSRPMGRQDIDDDGVMWFFAERDSRKIGQIAANPHVNVTLTSSSTWISIDGTAEIVDDPSKTHELWNGWVEAWLPQGPDDGSVILIKVTGESAEYWDTPGGRIASVISFVKAKVTGEPYDGGENERVTL